MDVRVFLSSTSEDLRDVRERIAKLLSAIPVELVQMETFGSDETQPLDYCLERVRSCNLFVGIYAGRYGTVDPETARSITELEYREAARMLGEGRLLGLLAYILDPEAAWRAKFFDREGDKVEALEALKAELQQAHVVSFFRDADDLSVKVLRDVLRKVGVGLGVAFAAKAPTVMGGVSEAVPVGMEHYTERDTVYFHGREEAVTRMCELVETHAVVLLIGDSGVGKTSLVRAGLCPALKSQGWAVACTRPLDNPDAVILEGLWGQLMQGPLPPGTTVGSALDLVAAAHAPRRVLLVIDQFEDAIPYLGTPNTSDLLAALGRAHSSPPGNLGLVLCYRGDMDAKVGKHWQVVSGSPTGLPRYYLEPLDAQAAQTILWEIFQAHAGEAPEAATEAFVKDIVRDLERESGATYPAGIYPPFLQMVAESLLRAADERGTRLWPELYRSLGGAAELIGRYLLNQVRFLDDHQPEGRRLLQALASRTRRLRKSIDELVAETGIERERVESCLARLTSLRLVRGSEDRWEIVHDFVAQRVVEDLSDPDEREARMFRDVLIAKAAAFDTTGGLLSVAEHVGLYSHRRRITCSPQEAELLFRGSLVGRGPVGYYLSQVGTEVAHGWAEKYRSSDDEKMRRNAYRFLGKHSAELRLDRAVEVFGEHKLQFELGALIGRCATDADEDLPLLLRLRRKRAEVTAEAARAALERVLTPAARHARAFQVLLRSRDVRDLRLLCRVLSRFAGARQIDEWRSKLADRSLLNRAAATIAIAAVGSREDERLLKTRLRRVKGTELVVCAFGLATRYQRSRRVKELISLLRAKPKEIVSGALEAMESDRGGLSVGHLLTLYNDLPRQVAEAVLRTVRAGDRPYLRRFVRRVRLDRHARNLLIALVRVGDSRDVRFVLELVARSPDVVAFWTVPLLVDCLADKADRSLLPWLAGLAEKREFWAYLGKDRGEDSLPIVNGENAYLFKRLVGGCLAAVCGASEWPLLKRLLFHDYWVIQVPAGRVIAQFGGEDELDDLLLEVRAHPTRVESPYGDSGIMSAICALDDKVYPLTAAGK